jgi:hypothetical protein
VTVRVAVAPGGLTVSVAVLVTPASDAEMVAVVAVAGALVEFPRRDLAAPS